MPHIIPSLFKLVGDGFVEDAYAADGNHLRWMFDERLGFPRHAFCLERRPSVQGENGPAHYEQFALLAGRSSNSILIVRPDLALTRGQAEGMFSNDKGVLLDNRPLSIDFHGGSLKSPQPYACFVDMHFKLRVPDGRVEAQAIYCHQGEQEIVDQGRCDASSQPASKVIQPPVSKPRSIFLSIWSQILSIIRRIGGALLPKPVQFADLSIRLSADRMDRVSLVGSNASLFGVRWVQSEELMKVEDWENVGCYPIATDEAEYVKLNSDSFEGRSARELAVQRLSEWLPHGLEALDDPHVPSSQAPQFAEMERRYLEPWLRLQEPWARFVLSKSSGGALHQAEVTSSGRISEAGRTSSSGIPSGLADLAGDMTITLHPFGALLMAACAFPAARLLGLAAVDQPAPEVAAWDYRVRGRWQIQDIQAWVGKLERQRNELLQKLGQASPAQKPNLRIQLAYLGVQLFQAHRFLWDLTGWTSDGILELFALKIGVQQTRHSLYNGPASLQARYHGQGASSQEALVRLEWPLRQRGRVLSNEIIPMGAALRRGLKGATEPGWEVINPPDPENGLPLLFIPADAGQQNQAEFFDRQVGSDIALLYGVSEVDPFGRWSPFTETDFAWEYDIAPLPPYKVVAQLEPSGSSPGFNLHIGFSWLVEGETPADITFSIYLRRQAPDSAHARDAGIWMSSGCEREPGTGEGPLEFVGNFAGNTTHDSMPVSVGSTTTTVSDPVTGEKPCLEFDVRLDGLILERDAIERAQMWVGIRTHDSRGLYSDEVGGPARAEHILDTPPSAPTLAGELLQATFADATNLSSFDLQWEGVENVRYVVYRAGETELVRYLQDRGYDTSACQDPADPAVRAAALKELAGHARDVFQPCSGLIPEPPRYPQDYDIEPLRGAYLEPRDWETAPLGGPLPSGPRRFTDRLPGSLRTITLYTVLGKSRSGVLSNWPESADHFTAVEIPQAPEPARPMVFWSGWLPPDPLSAPQRVELWIAEPPQKAGNPIGVPVAAYEVYRALDINKAEDYRRMRPLPRLVSPQYIVQDGRIPKDPPGFEPVVAVYVDPEVLPWRKYYYRVVARAPGAKEGICGMRSEASMVVEVNTLSVEPPAPPVSVMASLKTTTAGDHLEVTFKAEAPDVASGRFTFELVNISLQGPIILLRKTAGEVRLEPPTHFCIEVDDQSLIASLADPTLIAVRIKDPLGHCSESQPVALQRQNQ